MASDLVCWFAGDGLALRPFFARGRPISAPAIVVPGATGCQRRRRERGGRGGDERAAGGPIASHGKPRALAAVLFFPRRWWWSWRWSWWWRRRRRLRELLLLRCCVVVLLRCCLLSYFVFIFIPSLHFLGFPACLAISKRARAAPSPRLSRSFPAPFTPYVLGPHQRGNSAVPYYSVGFHPKKKHGETQNKIK